MAHCDLHKDEAIIVRYGDVDFGQFCAFDFEAQDPRRTIIIGTLGTVEFISIFLMYPSFGN